MSNFVKQSSRPRILESLDGCYASLRESLGYGGTADPAERVSFSRIPADFDMSFDERSDEELKVAVLREHSPIERERALWEYMFRPRHRQAELTSEVLRSDQDPAVRKSTLWLAQK